MAIKLKGNKLFFISDMHFGFPSYESSLEREKLLVYFLDTIKDEATDIFIVGDLFDFWFEWKFVVPRGFTRLLGKLSELADNAVNLHYFAGNHDLWLFGYLEKEIGMKIYHKPEIFTCEDKTFCVAHGDGLGPGDISFKITKKIFCNRFLQRAFASLHPNIAIAIARFFSLANKSKYANTEKTRLASEKIFKSQQIYAKKLLKDNKIDYFIFAHQHTPRKVQIDNAQLYNIGNWITDFSYISYNNGQIIHNFFKR